MPMGPAPVTRTSSASRLKDRAVWVALPKGSKMEYSSSGILEEQEITLEAGMTRYSANAPLRLTPTPEVFLHRCPRPERQLRHIPQTMCPSPETSSPMWCPWTEEPISTISPTYSCPAVVPTRKVFCAHSFQSQICTSVPQMAVLWILIMTSFSPTVGISTRFMERPFAG